MANNDDEEDLIIVTWSNHLAANPDDGSAGKQAVSNTAKYHPAFCCTLCNVLQNIAFNFITLGNFTLHCKSLQCNSWKIGCVSFSAKDDAVLCCNVCIAQHAGNNIAQHELNFIAQHNVTILLYWKSLKFKSWKTESQQCKRWCCIELKLLYCTKWT